MLLPFTTDQVVKVAIVGSRNYEDLSFVQSFVRSLALKYPRAIIVSGGARGVDTAAEQQALRSGLRTTIFKPDWNRYGRQAGFLRNTDIINEAHVVVVFWDGESRGTADDMNKARKANKPMFIYGPDGRPMCIK